MNKDKVDKKDKKIAELTEDLQRTRADFENYRKQVEAQKVQYGNVVKFTTITKILPLLDDIERAILAYPEQLESLQKNFDKTLVDLGLVKISSEVGVDFNPDLHEAVAVEGDGEIEKIAETLRNGYIYDGEVLRPAMVKVAKQ
ncbi:MAG: nucleotide exchange factor GrpE [Candidatus Saccharimonadales bacterium]